MNKASTYKIRLVKGDKVVVRSGKYRGQTGIVTGVHPRSNSATVEGINIVKKHVKPNRQHPQGGIIEIQRPLTVSKLGILDDKNKPSRIGYKFDADGNKFRIYKTTGKQIPAARPKNKGKGK